MVVFGADQAWADLPIYGTFETVGPVEGGTFRGPDGQFNARLTVEPRSKGTLVLTPVGGGEPVSYDISWRYASGSKTFALKVNGRRIRDTFEIAGDKVRFGDLDWIRVGADGQRPDAQPADPQPAEPQPAGEPPSVSPPAPPPPAVATDRKPARPPAPAAREQPAAPLGNDPVIAEPAAVANVGASASPRAAERRSRRGLVGVWAAPIVGGDVLLLDLQPDGAARLAYLRGGVIIGARPGTWSRNPGGLALQLGTLRRELTTSAAGFDWLGVTWRPL
ncbi:MAG TPA: hypothetical protein VML75_13170 [Kofleriaceae bacterium]|nr:hypothetical protein [Kofleriaceae bacterium]